MKPSSLCSGLACAAIVGVLAWAAFPSRTEASQSGFAATQVAAPAFLQASLRAPVAAPGGAGGPQLGPGLPSSVMPHSDAQCSVEAPGNPDAACSAFTTTGPTCSAHCDSGQLCSAFESSPGFGTASCSTMLLPGTRCSVLPPASIPPQGARCSALGGDRVFCSVLAPNGNQGKQSCSAMNPGSSGNFCSAEHYPFLGPATPQCSVLGSDTSRKSYCSTAYAGSKTCSALGELSPNGGPAACSVRQGQYGICTSFKGAPAASCSVINPPGSCSVIGGSPGGVHCRQP